MMPPRSLSLVAAVLAGCVAAVPASGGGTTPARGGAGVFVSADGDVVTARHIVEGCAAVRVAGFGFAEAPARIVALPADGGTDLVLLHAEVKAPGVARFRDVWPTAETWPVIDAGPLQALGYPGEALGPVAPTRLAVPRVVPAAASDEDVPRDAAPDPSRRRLLLLVAPVVAGYSGGPVVDGQGRVVGIVVLFNTDPDLTRALDGAASGFALPAATISKFLGEAGVAAATPAPDGEASPERQVARVFCYA